MCRGAVFCVAQLSSQPKLPTAAHPSLLTRSPAQAPLLELCPSWNLDCSLRPLSAPLGSFQAPAPWETEDN